MILKEKINMRLRKLAISDLLKRVEWVNSPNVHQSMHFDVPISFENTLKWFKNNQNNMSRSDVVFEDDNGNIVAMGGLTSIDHKLRKGELYIFVGPEHQGKGYGTEATRLLCQYGFNSLELYKIYLYTNSNNFSAIRTYEKVGFKLEGVLRKEILYKDNLIDRLYFGLLNTDFNKGNEFIKTDFINIDNMPVLIFRDDIFPEIGGGVKARKAVQYEKYMTVNGYNACVTTGGIQSNHNRAIALMCARHGWKCHIVFHGTRERFEAEKGNALLIRNSGASFQFVEAGQIGPTMDEAMEHFKCAGLKPLYIHGGGHDIPGGVALVEAVKELKVKCDAIGYKPKYIFHASGTGSTQAGIAVGLSLIGWDDVSLIGISVARNKERGTQVIEDFANMLAEYYGLKIDFRGKINFNTDYLSGGYEQFTPEMEHFITDTMKSSGIMFDTTYSGKALYGMHDYIKKNQIRDNVLFWHTGGLMNIMA